MSVVVGIVRGKENVSAKVAAGLSDSPVPAPASAKLLSRVPVRWPVKKVSPPKGFEVDPAREQQRQEWLAAMKIAWKGLQEENKSVDELETGLQSIVDAWETDKKVRV